MVTNNPYAQYKERSLSTLAPGELLVKLFDELIKQCRWATMSIDKKDYAAVNDALTKSQTILATLDSALDMRYPISAELRNMYVFLGKEMLRANISKNKKIVNDILPLIKDLRDSFDQAEKINRRSQHLTEAGSRAV